MCNDPFFHFNLYKAQERAQQWLAEADRDRQWQAPHPHQPRLIQRWLLWLSDGLIACGLALQRRYA